jgi:hypothetical protein
LLPALPSLLRYLHVAGHIRSSAGRSGPGGTALETGPAARGAADHLRAALASCDRHSADHCHGYAVVLAMARLALRAGEVAGLRLATSAGSLLVLAQTTSRSNGRRGARSSQPCNWPQTWLRAPSVGRVRRYPTW